MAEEGSEPRESGDELQPRFRNLDLDEPGALAGALNTHENLLTLNSQDDQLLPGLPNEIVLEEIVPKLSWKVFYTLSLVSRSWRQAIRNHEVHDARLRSHSNETFLVCNHKFRVDEKHDDSNVLSLYAVRDKSWLQLPPLPQPQRGLPDYSRFVSLDGKIYVLTVGETSQLYTEDWRPRRDWRQVYVLDLAGQRNWERCANMLESRFDFLCGAINGKIYVFGRSQDEIEHMQVYDPNENAWSVVLAPSMERMESMERMDFGCICNVVTIGEELFLDIGTVTGEEESWDAEIYHPRNDEWRRDTNFQFFHEGGLFTAHGKLHRMTSSGIDVYHVDGNFWTRLHSIRSRLPFRGNLLTNVDIGAEIYVIVVTLQDELFVLADCGFFGYGLFQGQGFGKEGKEIVWEKLTCPFQYAEGFWTIHRFMWTIQL